MDVAENENVVKGMLLDEYSRCQDILASLKRRVEESPKGSLRIRKRIINGKAYTYPYLVFRQGHKVINKYIPRAELSFNEVYKIAEGYILHIPFSKQFQ